VTPAAQAKSVDLLLDHPEELGPCHTDAPRVEQILVNLLTNAIRHSPPGAPVRIRVHHEGGTLGMDVADEGRGIPPENLDHVFDVYYTKAGEEGQGVGLGLPLSRRLARLLGGDLVAANRPEGGAVFTLILPL
jgi:two-component system sensor histidine kinase KdpD